MRYNKFIKNCLFILILYTLWGFIFTHSIIANPLFVYCSFLGLGFLFAIVFIRYFRGVNLNGANLWLPYMLYTLVGYMVTGNIEVSIYWFIAIVMLLTAYRIEYYRIIPSNLLLISGFICVLGILVQIFAPTLYYFIASNIFNSGSFRLINLWQSSSYGYAGFTYQLGMTAVILLYAECIWLFTHKYSNNKFSSVFFHWSIAAIFVLCIFLTGKRMLSAISVIIPFIIYAIASRKTSRFVLLSMFGVMFAIAAYTYIEANSSQLSDSAILGRFAGTIEAQKDGYDISSGREELKYAALELYKTSPLWGIGCGKFIEKSGEDSDVHNSYIQILCEQGIIGILLFMIPLIYVLFVTLSLLRRVDSAYVKISLFYQLVFIIYALSGNVTVNPFGFLMYYIAIAMLVSLKFKYRL